MPGKTFWLVSGSLTRGKAVKSAILPENTVSGGFWEERTVKVTKTIIKIYVVQTVSDCGYVEKQAHPQQRG
jgi:hypothetical protein